ncbi:2-amino-4-hydroxy-6-hydroxymethyldihydropteridine diphosphokinase [Gordonia otitidis]|uniref:2-amino-4-hydroxy-6- hydroxymethyldihydropteridine diphosphokinase n=1 Tax=Gordonia otitidis TaxID=249058 RepID=UPI001D1472ED|nr:2-amino-4-hydroxy-6-hydroxymethyldihydropteridine diphosphokinase [Gordonia otitidis]UEA57646.1 2-amino-4-hydroxy-6-hydroxymethyldihydropteridine diphosphokinase [Gordonia otitidis]
MTRAILSAGTNLGDRAARLHEVVDALADDLVAASSIYTTAPWGGVEQPDFYNITLIVDGPISARDWLQRGFDLERAAHRTREVRWGPRTLDVDVICASDDAGTPIISADEELTLPHPRAAQRAFVLVPWLEIEPNATLWTPDGPRSVVDLVEALPTAEREGVRRLTTNGGPASSEAVG